MSNEQTKVRYFCKQCGEELNLENMILDDNGAPFFWSFCSLECCKAYTLHQLVKENVKRTARTLERSKKRP